MAWGFCLREGVFMVCLAFFENFLENQQGNQYHRQGNDRILRIELTGTKQQNDTKKSENQTPENRPFVQPVIQRTENNREKRQI